MRAFLAEQGGWSAHERARGWNGHDRDFSRKLAAMGWVGLTWPLEYGGGGRSQAERYVVTEELVAAGAPVSAHWAGDRQVGPLLLKFGSEALKRDFLPLLARAEITFCLGMSEPDAGSDLASVRTAARAVEGGWRVTGQKIWTSGAHVADYMVALVRTGADEERHRGLSQLIIDMTGEGVSVRPIRTMTGEAHFNEVFLDDVFVPAERLVGVEGQGWAQVSAELAYERSGPERYLSSFAALTEAVDQLDEQGPASDCSMVGAFIVEHFVLRQMSLEVSRQLSAGENPTVAAAMVKDLGAALEQAIPPALQDLAPMPPAGRSALGYLLKSSPSFSLRGGTREILRGIIAKDLGVR